MEGRVYLLGVPDRILENVDQFRFCCLDHVNIGSNMGSGPSREGRLVRCFILCNHKLELGYSSRYPTYRRRLA
jgi:hypothetical protein